jgi:hypothetical protein
MRSQKNRIAVLLRLRRAGDWLSADDFYDEGDDAQRRLIAQTLRRCRAQGFVEANTEARPWKYRITPAGRSELGILTDSQLYFRRMAERMRKLTAARWPGTVAA